VRSLIFPYIKLGTLYLPIVPVTLFSRSSSFKTEAYVDSGAFYSIFRSEMLENLQLRKEQGNLKMLRAADGKLLQARLFRLPIELGDVRIRALIAFSDELHIGFNLLGRQTVFNAFDEVAFNERKRNVVFRGGE
jgi:hypothetical protein